MIQGANIAFLGNWNRKDMTKIASQDAAQYLQLPIDNHVGPLDLTEHMTKDFCQGGLAVNTCTSNVQNGGAFIAFPQVWHLNAPKTSVIVNFR